MRWKEWNSLTQLWKIVAIFPVSHTNDCSHAKNEIQGLKNHSSRAINSFAQLENDFWHARNRFQGLENHFALVENYF